MRASATVICFAVQIILLSLLPIVGDAQQQEQDKTATKPSPALSLAGSEVGIGDLYAVVVGVGVYKHPKIPKLNVSDKDAKDFAAFLESQRSLFRNVHLTLLINEQASKPEIEKELYYRLRRAGKDDTVIVFLSGHGADDPNTPGEFFFLSHDADPQFLMATAVHMNRQWFLNKLDSKRVVVIADACHAGGFGGAGSKSLPPSLQNFVSHFRESEGKVFVTSSRSDEYSQEMSGMDNSIFTHFLLSGLAGASDRDSDGIVTLKELYDYVYTRTKDATNGFQHPQMEGRLVGQFPLSLAHGETEAAAQKLQQPQSVSEPVQAPVDDMVKIRELAERGDPEAQLRLGGMYEAGLGVPRDQEQAALWYSRAAKKGHEKASKAITRLQSQGTSTPAGSQTGGKTEPVKIASLPPGDQYLQRATDLTNRIAAGDESARKARTELYGDSTARESLRRSAEAGDPRAQFHLGNILVSGTGVTKDYVEAVKWYRKGAEQGYAPAQVNLGTMYSSGQGVAKDHDEAVKLYRKAADEGYAFAQNNLGSAYEHGQGVAKDHDEAVKLYRKAAEQGLALAQNNLGSMYARGHGVGKDYNEALRWYRKAAEQGNSTAQLSLGIAYEHGQGVPKDYSEAVRWYRKAAEQGHARAQAFLAFMYRQGYGVQKDYKEALEWARKSVEQNDGYGSNVLGQMYEAGQGVPRDPQEGFKFFRKSAELGEARGMCHVGWCYDAGKGVRQDSNEAFKWYRKAAEQGDDQGMANLGNAYRQGRGVAQDREEAIKWLTKAAELGNEDGKKRLAEMKGSGSKRRPRAEAEDDE
ncbi:MAG: SEL1-like repeat protein [Desulfomonile tiedjei]|uniref:SEL1-like repeat protein n=1 Tax=Desulfomonile tiedjei TaxID=2358 RepID=A0A9D6V2Y2_9BACT|nr:SEL1-like repeat protein [Desulfomonile tiedjei]